MKRDRRKTIKISPDLYSKLLDISRTLNCRHLYETIGKLVEVYEKVEVIQHILGAEDIDETFQMISEFLPKSQMQRRIAEANRFLDKLRQLGVPRSELNVISETIFKVIVRE